MSETIKLHSIAGVYESPEDMFPGYPSIAFGGYFKSNFQGMIRGELIDILGRSEIEGTITEQELRFLKQYTDNSGNPVDNAIKYSLTRDGEGWSGLYRWDGSETIFAQEGGAKCITHVVEDNATDIVAGPIPGRRTQTFPSFADITPELS